jgi:hypothetical protein
MVNALENGSLIPVGMTLLLKFENAPLTDVEEEVAVRMVKVFELLGMNTEPPVPVISATVNEPPSVAAPLTLTVEYFPLSVVSWKSADAEVPLILMDKVPAAF